VIKYRGLRPKVFRVSKLHPPAHTAAIHVDVPAATAFAFMADGMKQSEWALGSWDRRRHSDDVFVGTSRWDFEDLYVRLRSDPDLLLVDYFGGKDPDDLRWIVSARVVPGDQLGLGPQRSLITMTCWRGADTTDEAWELQSHIWPTEIALIKALVERDAAVAAAAS
jgi:hypothetical protein